MPGLLLKTQLASAGLPLRMSITSPLWLVNEQAVMAGLPPAICSDWLLAVNAQLENEPPALLKFAAKTRFEKTQFITANALPVLVTPVEASRNMKPSSNALVRPDVDRRMALFPLPGNTPSRTVGLTAQLRWAKFVSVPLNPPRRARLSGSTSDPLVLPESET